MFTSFQNAIDLDQEAMEAQLALGTTDSYSYAEVTVADPGLPQAIPAGASIVGTTTSGTEVRGMALESAESGAKTLTVQYATTDIQASYVNCQVGALGDAGNSEGCK